jgi:uroporphyrinogen-III synthase
LQALGKIMGAELPKIPGGSNVVLYPSSARAGKDLQESLIASGFSVNRVHTYDTVSLRKGSIEFRVKRQFIN